MVQNSQSDQKSLITHEIFMRYDKVGKSYVWKLDESASPIVIPEDQVPTLLDSVKKDTPEMIERALRSLSSGIELIATENISHKRSAIEESIKNLNVVFVEIKNGGFLESNPSLIPRALHLSVNIEKIILETSASLAAKKLFSDFRTLIKDVENKFEIFIVLKILLDAAKKDPEGKWVSACDKPLVPGQAKIQVGL
jgi:hypothetical protein